MPQRSDRPGFKRGRHNLPYWIASQVARDTMAFPDKCIPLPPDADDDTIGDLCRYHTKRLNLWIETHGNDDPKMPPYDGTVYSACQVYQKHPLSRFHKVKANTRGSYVDSLKIIEATVGKRLIRNLTVFDVQNWYDQWRRPAEKGGLERIDRAHDAVAMFRTVLRFLAALRKPECKLLAEELKLIQFEKGGAREAEMTYAYASAFVRKALELGQAGLMPRDRALHMAIGTAAQFELMLRQKDIIGDWAKSPLDAEKAIAKGATAIKAGDEVWTGWFAWERIPGWRWRMKTSKSKYRSPADFDLQNYSLLFPLLERVDHSLRTGAIVKGDNGLPIRETSHRTWFRKIARAADIPDEVWNMDNRAGGATEAEEAGVALTDIQAAMNHSKETMTLRYIRRRSKKVAVVAEARNLHRKGESDV